MEALQAEATADTAFANAEEVREGSQEIVGHKTIGVIHTACSDHTQDETGYAHLSL